jgi:hypothetical protein
LPAVVRSLLSPNKSPGPQHVSNSVLVAESAAHQVGVQHFCWLRDVCAHRLLCHFLDVSPHLRVSLSSLSTPFELGASCKMAWRYAISLNGLSVQDPVVA